MRELLCCGNTTTSGPRPGLRRNRHVLRGPTKGVSSMGGLLERIGKIIAVNISVMADKAEAPERALREYGATAQTARAEVHEALVDARAELLILQRRAQASEEQSRKWAKRAEQAVSEDDEDRARQALRRQKSFEDANVEWAAQVQAQDRQVARLETAGRQLSDRIEDAEIRMSSVLSRHKAAETMLRTADLFRQVGESSGEVGDLEIMEDELDHQEAHAEALAEMSAASVRDRLRALEHGASDEEIELRLAELKKKVGAEEAEETEDEG